MTNPHAQIEEKLDDVVDLEDRLLDAVVTFLESPTGSALLESIADTPEGARLAGLLKDYTNATEVLRAFTAAAEVLPDFDA